MTTTLDVFISSKMVELKAERDALYALLPTLDYGDIKLHAWVFEEDAPATSKSVRDVYLKALQNSALYIGLFANLYGEYTIDEFDRATAWGMERHIYVKNDEQANEHTRTPELTAFLTQHGNVQSGITAKWFKTTNELTAAVQKSIETWISERLRSRPGATSATLVRDPDDLIEKPRKLIGRDDLLRDVTKLLDDHERVLLQAFGGMGKTALAATIAAEWIKADKGAVLWLEAGSSSSNALFEALARTFNAQQAVASEVGDNQFRVLRQLLRQSEAKLLVLDNSWDGNALFTILKAIPSDMPVLVTARQRYALDKIRDVSELDPADALELLSYHADHDYTSDPKAVELCDRLGHHALSIENAGKNLNARKLLPAAILEQIKHTLHDLKVPSEFNEKGRTSFKDLMDADVDALDDEAYAVFFAFGAFFAPTITMEMLSLYLNQIILSARGDLVTAQTVSEQVVSMIPIVSEALPLLHDRGLVEDLSTTNGIYEQCHLHDLIFSYVSSQLEGDRKRHALQVCLKYAELYSGSEPYLDEKIRLELDNLLGAVSWALSEGQYTEVEELIRHLVNFFLTNGHSEREISMLKQAIEITDKQGRRPEQATRLRDICSAYYMLGQYQFAIESGQQALTIGQEVGDKRFMISCLALLGKIDHARQQNQEAIDRWTQALNFAREIGDRRLEGQQTGFLASAYIRVAGRGQDAFDHWQRALAISREMGDKFFEIEQLSFLGNAYIEIAQQQRSVDLFENAIACFKTGLLVARQEGYRQKEAIALNDLAGAYNDVALFRQSIEYSKIALAIFREVNYKLYEANSLGHLGDAWFFLGKHKNAREYYQQAKVIYEELGFDAQAKYCGAMLLTMHNPIPRMIKRIKYIWPRIKLLSQLYVKYQGLDATADVDPT